MTEASKNEAVRKRRSDFEQNRETILQAADRAFAEVGPDVSISAIAERAGVGPATIYRHFANRHLLGKAVYELRLDLYTEVVTNAQAAADPAHAFRSAIQGIVELQARDKSFRDLIGIYEAELPNVSDDSKLAVFGATMLSIFGRARDAGAIRADVTDADIALLLLASEGIARLATEHSMLPLQRVVNVLLDGIMGTTTVLDGPDLTDDELFKFT